MMAGNEDQLRAVAARAVTDSLRAAASRCSAADRAARFRDCVRSLEAEKAKMEVFRRELPISVHLVADGTRLLLPSPPNAYARAVTDSCPFLIASLLPSPCSDRLAQGGARAAPPPPVGPLRATSAAAAGKGRSRLGGRGRGRQRQAQLDELRAALELR